MMNQVLIKAFSNSLWMKKTEVFFAFFTQLSSLKDFPSN